MFFSLSFFGIFLIHFKVFDLIDAIAKRSVNGVISFWNGFWSCGVQKVLHLYDLLFFVSLLLLIGTQTNRILKRFTLSWCVKVWNERISLLSKVLFIFQHIQLPKKTAVKILKNCYFKSVCFFYLLLIYERESYTRSPNEMNKKQNVVGGVHIQFK